MEVVAKEMLKAQLWMVSGTQQRCGVVVEDEMHECKAQFAVVKHRCVVNSIAKPCWMNDNLTHASYRDLCNITVVRGFGFCATDNVELMARLACPCISICCVLEGG